MAGATAQRWEDIEELEDLVEQLQMSFWVDFTEEDIQQAATVGLLFDSMVEKMGGLGSPKCLSSFAFYRLRCSLVKVSGLDRRTLRPDTPLQSLLTPKVRRIWWTDIENNLRFRVPGLRFGRAGKTACYLVGLLTLVSFVAGGALALGLFIAGFWAIVELTPRLSRELPVDTLGQLTRSAVKLNQQKLAREAGGSTVNQAWSAYRELLSDSIGVPAASISRELPLRIPRR